MKFTIAIIKKQYTSIGYKKETAAAAEEKGMWTLEDEIASCLPGNTQLRKVRGSHSIAIAERRS
jgi:hypothetical protein